MLDLINKPFLKGALLTIALILLNQIFIQYFLYQKREDSKTINIAGRQRMLSQRLSYEFLRMANGHGHSDMTLQLYNEWHNQHTALIEGNDSLGINPMDTDSIKSALISSKKYIDNLKPYFQIDSLNLAQIEEVSKNQNEFLIEMEGIVKMLEQRAEIKLSFIVLAEIVLAVISIIVLLMEIKFLYRKVAIRQQQLLQIQAEQLNRIAWEHSHSFRGPIASLSGLAYMYIHEADNLSSEDREQIMHFIEIETGRLDQLTSNAVKVSIGDMDLN